MEPPEEERRWVGDLVGMPVDGLRSRRNLEEGLVVGIRKAHGEAQRSDEVGGVSEEVQDNVHGVGRQGELRASEDVLVLLKHPAVDVHADGPIEGEIEVASAGVHRGQEGGDEDLRIKNDSHRL